MHEKIKYGTLYCISQELNSFTIAHAVLERHTVADVGLNRKIWRCYGDF